MGRELWKKMQELRIVDPENLKSGMMLAEDLCKDGKVLIKEGYVVTQVIIEKIKGFYTGKFKVYVTIEDENPKKPEQSTALPVSIVEKGEFVCREGDISKHIYILQKGSLDVLVSKNIVHGGNRVKTISKVSVIDVPGTSFGEIGAILESPRTASIQASSQSKIISIEVFKKGLGNTILGNPGLGISISINLARRLKENNTKIKGLLTLLTELEERLTFFVRSYVTICKGIGEIAVKYKDEFLEKIYQQMKNSQMYGLGIARKRDRVKNEKPEAVNVISVRSTSSIVDIEANENLFQEGDPGDTIYILTSGKLAVYVGNKQVSVIDTKGEIIGEITALLGHSSQKYEARNTTIKAILYSQVVAVAGNQIEQLINNDPALMVHIVKTLSKRLPISNEKLMDCMDDYKSAMKKICSFDEFREMGDNMRNSHLKKELEKQIQVSELIYRKMSETAEKFDKDYTILMAYTEK